MHRPCAHIYFGALADSNVERTVRPPLLNRFSIRINVRLGYIMHLFTVPHMYTSLGTRTSPDTRKNMPNNWKSWRFSSGASVNYKIHGTMVPPSSTLQKTSWANNNTVKMPPTNLDFGILG